MTQPLQATLENRDDAWVLTLVRDFGQPDWRVSPTDTGWHLCLDVLDDVANGVDRPPVVGQDAAAHGWEPLRDKYSDALGV